MIRQRFVFVLVDRVIVVDYMDKIVSKTPKYYLKFLLQDLAITFQLFRAKEFKKIKKRLTSQFTGSLHAHYG